MAVAPVTASGALPLTLVAADRAPGSIPCMVMNVAVASITPDSVVEVSVVTSKLLTAISKQGTWITHQDLQGKAAVTGAGDQPVPVKSKVKLNLRFTTPGGPLILRNVICWVTEQPLPMGVGDLLLSRWIMERLGYSAEKPLAAAQQICSE
ncbi:hypothetical protein L917_20723 [Phytophthora nicotianae]|nr:hypothetical protein L917_20723 [Phytophthora nicotianae]